MRRYLNAKRQAGALFGSDLERRATHAVLTRDTRTVARVSQAQFRAVDPPPYRCVACHRAFCFYRQW